MCGATEFHNEELNKYYCSEVVPCETYENCTFLEDLTGYYYCCAPVDNEEISTDFYFTNSICIINELSGDYDTLGNGYDVYLECTELNPNEPPEPDSSLKLLISLSSIAILILSGIV